TGLVLDPDARAESLGVAAQQRLEIIKALARPTRVLILDEPTAVLAPREADDLLRWVREFATSGDGRAVVLITHKLREALAVADGVTVLRHGTTVLSGPSAGLGEAVLVNAMIGSSVPSERQEARAHRHGDAVVTARDLTVADAAGRPRIAAATFEIAGGETVGIAGVEGAGHRELLRAIAGRLAPGGGSLAIPARIGFVPEDRQRDALVLDMPLFENVALRDAGVARGLLRWGEIRARTRTLLERFDVRAPDIGLPASALSGGNQQRLVLARELDGPPPLLVVESPTRGLDVRATAAVHDHLRRARDGGVAIALYSSDLDEMLLLADRVLVVFAGTVREVPRDRETIGRAMVGVG
ncbi:MAG TPA: ATP-binding cassette domain-containing protein, partial [Gemmatimonadaceae bacterium]|nr:ATP-binding cassette domain-containing protein [Gemmatimonadaceae bacterium]